MKDAQGHDFNELVQIQAMHLALWRPRVVPEIMQPVEAYVLAMNQPAAAPDQKHRVFRGQSIIELIRLWPDIDSSFPPLPEAPVAYEGV